MQIILKDLGLLVVGIIGLALLGGAYNKGRSSGHAKGKAEAGQETQSLQESLNRSQETVEELKSNVSKLETRLSDKSKKLEQLEAGKEKAIADAIAVKKSELKEKQAKLQTDFDKARHELESKIRAEMEAEFKIKQKGIEAEFKGKQEGIEAEFNIRHEKERTTLWAFIGVALDGDERLIELFKVLPRTDVLACLMKAKKDKAMLKDLQAAAGLGQEHFTKVVETKIQTLSESSAGGEQLGSTDNEILALLKKGPLSHGKIVKAAGKPKATVSDALSRLRDSGLVEQDPNTGDYYAL